MSHSKVSKEMVPGRVLLISKDGHINKLAVILATSNILKKISYKVLVLTDDVKDVASERPEMWYKMISLVRDEIYSPIGVVTHIVLSINQLDIWEVSSKVLKINADLVLKDWEKRQIPRFKNDPPGQSCNLAIQELSKLTISATGKNKPDCDLVYLHFIHDFKINDQDLYEKILMLDKLRDQLYYQVDSVKIPNFDEQYASVFNRKYLEDQRDHLKYQLSYSSMALYPDYESRIQLLKELNYIDAQNRGK